MKNKELYKLIKKVNKNLIRTSSVMFKTHLDMGILISFPFIENMIDDRSFMDSLLGIAQNSKMEAIKYIDRSYNTRFTRTIHTIDSFYIIFLRIRIL